MPKQKMSIYLYIYNQMILLKQLSALKIYYISKKFKFLARMASVYLKQDIEPLIDFIRTSHGFFNFFVRTMYEWLEI